MRVAILGVGGLGRTLASELRGDPRVTSLLLIDLFGERARVLTGIRGRVAIEAKQLNVENRIALTKAIAGSDLVINTTLPKYNIGIMQAALEVRANYLDPSAAGPREAGGLAGIFEQLAMGEAFKAAGLTALVSMGLDPGISNVMARSAAERLDTVDAIRIRSGSVAALPRYTSFPLYSREVFLSDVLTPPTVWLDGALRRRPAPRRRGVAQRAGRRPDGWEGSRAPRRRHLDASGGQPEAFDDRGLVPGRRRRRHRARAHRGPGDARAGRPSRRDLGPGARVQRMGRSGPPDVLVRACPRGLSIPVRRFQNAVPQRGFKRCNHLPAKCRVGRCFERTHGRFSNCTSTGFSSLFCPRC